MWLSPLIAASAKPGAGTWNAKLSQMNPASSAWLSSTYIADVTPPALWPSRNTGSPGWRDFAIFTVPATSPHSPATFST